MDYLDDNYNFAKTKLLAHWIILTEHDGPNCGMTNNYIIFMALFEVKWRDQELLSSSWMMI